MNLNDFLEQNILITRTFNHLNDLDFNGYYLLSDPAKQDEIVYIGSAYKDTVKVRVRRYINSGDTGGNSLRNTVKVEYKTNNPIQVIRTFNITAVYQDDPEYRFINEVSPLLNSKGK
jgi:hypothetical protein